MSKTVCFIGLGSNVSGRRGNIRKAIEKIKNLEDTKVLKTSKVIETHPVGGPANQPKFLNAAIKIMTSLPPLGLFQELKSIEKQLGRKNTYKNGPRIIDLDILIYGCLYMRTKKLSLPHPRLFQRYFALKPLFEVL